MASAENKRLAREFIESMHDFRGSGTLPVPPMKAAMEEAPDVIFLLTDGDFLSSDSSELLAMTKGRKVPVEAVGFGDNVNVSFLRKLAEQSGGQYSPGRMYYRERKIVCMSLRA